jgi:hypothetical protein
MLGTVLDGRHVFQALGSSRLIFGNRSCRHWIPPTTEPPYNAEVAQLVEHSPEKAGVDSSILSLGTTFPVLTLF